jgi:hypothetical protein
MVDQRGDSGLRPGARPLQLPSRSLVASTSAWHAASCVLSSPPISKVCVVFASAAGRCPATFVWSDMYSLSDSQCGSVIQHRSCPPLTQSIQMLTVGQAVWLIPCRYRAHDQPNSICQLADVRWDRVKGEGGGLHASLGHRPAHERKAQLPSRTGRNLQSRLKNLRSRHQHGGDQNLRFE